jgi:hypothetical protein
MFISPTITAEEEGKTKNKLLSLNRLPVRNSLSTAAYKEPDISHQKITLTGF